MDGVAIIDSDPGGYPGSTNAEFVNLLLAHRKMFDSLRPGIELVYWNHVGWPAYGRWYQTGKFNFGTEEEFVEALTLLKQNDPKPWGIANGLKYAEKVGVADKVISFNYGRIEGEPSLPMTRFDVAGACEAGKSKGPRGVMGNAQTHCVQLPNTFAFARGATGKPIAREDFVRFAEDLIPGQGELIVQGWESLESGYTAAMRVAADRLDQLPGSQAQGRAAEGAAVQQSQALRGGPRVHAPAEGRFPGLRGRLGIGHRSQDGAGRVRGRAERLAGAHGLPERVELAEAGGIAGPPALAARGQALPARHHEPGQRAGSHPLRESRQFPQAQRDLHPRPDPGVERDAQDDAVSYLTRCSPCPARLLTEALSSQSGPSRRHSKSVRLRLSASVLAPSPATARRESRPPRIFGA